MSRISCLIVETDQESIRQIDILSRRSGAFEVRWKTHSLTTGWTSSGSTRRRWQSSAWDRTSTTQSGISP